MVQNKTDELKKDEILLLFKETISVANGTLKPYELLTERDEVVILFNSSFPSLRSEFKKIEKELTPFWE